MAEFLTYKPISKDRAMQVAKDYQFLVGQKMAGKTIKYIIPHPHNNVMIGKTISDFANGHEINSEWNYEGEYFVLTLLRKEGLMDSGIDLLLYFHDNAEFEKIAKYGL